MSRSSAITPASSTESLQFSLAPDAPERVFRVISGLLVLLFACLSLWFFPLSSLDSNLFLLALVFVFFFWQLGRPINGELASQMLRFDSNQWWLGRAGEWQPLTLVRHRCYGAWLITARFSSPQQGVVRVWIFPSAPDCTAHRRCRVMLG